MTMMEKVLNLMDMIVPTSRKESGLNQEEALVWKNMSLCACGRVSFFIATYMIVKHE